jgi:hypothetical protein
LLLPLLLLLLLPWALLQALLLLPLRLQVQLLLPSSCLLHLQQRSCEKLACCYRHLMNSCVLLWCCGCVLTCWQRRHCCCTYSHQGTTQGVKAWG